MSPGFAWRLQDESGIATGIRISSDPLLAPLVNQMPSFMTEPSRRVGLEELQFVGARLPTTVGQLR